MATLAFLLVGCGGGSDDGAATTAESSGSAAPSPSVSTPGQGGAQTSGPSAEPAVQAAEPAGATPDEEPKQSEPNEQPAEVKPSEVGAAEVKPAEVKPDVVQAAPEPEPTREAGPPEMPKVYLGQGPYAQSTLLKVGDTVPELAVTNLDGTATTVAPPGEGELLVLVFWDSTNAYSTLELRYLQRNLAGQEGIRMAAINRGESAEAVKAIVEKEALSFPVLLDAEGSLFGQFATQTLPRSYLIGEGGEILWLEVTFQGRTTIKTLQQAIAAAQAR
jgi:peroxiredoxin